MNQIIVNSILIVAMLSNLLASTFVVVVQLQSNAERQANSLHASQERKEMRCILRIEISDRSQAAIDRCHTESLK